MHVVEISVEFLPTRDTHFQDRVEEQELGHQSTNFHLQCRRKTRLSSL